MQWSPDRNSGFSAANPQSLYLPLIIDPEYHYEQVNVETQQANTSSLLWWMKRIIATRKRFDAFSRGTIRFVNSDNTHVLAFLREFEDEVILVVANFSRYSQSAELELQDYSEYQPQEIFSHNQFPAITDRPYSIMIGSSDYYWFKLERIQSSVSEEGDGVPRVEISNRDWATFSPALRELLQKKVLLSFIRQARWFRQKGAAVRKLRIDDVGPIGPSDSKSWIVLVTLETGQDATDTYLLVLSKAGRGEAENVLEEHPGAVIAGLGEDLDEGVIYDGVYNTDVRTHLLNSFLGRKKFKTENGEILVHRSKALASMAKDLDDPTQSRVLKVEQSNTSMLYRDTFFFKLFRKLEEGINPDIELLQHLSEEASFEHVPRYGGSLSYKRGKKEAAALGLLISFEPNQSDGWGYATSSVDRYFENILARSDLSVPKTPASIFETGLSKVPDDLMQVADSLFFELIALLGKRTGELHLALAATRDRAELTPEPFTKLYQRSAYQSLRSLIRRTIGKVRRVRKKLEPAHAARADEFVHSETKMLDYISNITDHTIKAEKIRIHGDYHLGQVLFTGRDFTIIDLEGEPARTLSERRLKFSAFRDVAGMIRSFHYAISSRFLQRKELREEDAAVLEPWIETWFSYVAGTFLEAYRETVDGVSFVPDDPADVEMLVNLFMLEKAVYEVGYEIDNRPDWLMIPLRGVSYVLGDLAGEQ